MKSKIKILICLFVLCVYIFTLISCGDENNINTSEENINTESENSSVQTQDENTITTESTDEITSAEETTSEEDTEESIIQTETEEQTETDTSSETEEQSETEEVEPVTIDIYFIAGQSNAAGHTKVADKESAYLFAPELEDGFTNVMFCGYASSNTLYTWRKTRLGYGAGSDRKSFGPEAGMAEALSVYYNEETGNLAGIIKVAYGGTNLLNDTNGSNLQYRGNWVSPSYAEAKGYSYEDDVITGGLYRKFMQITKVQLSKLPKSAKSFNIKGLYWMQGESDRYNPEEYKVAFEYFVNDLRRDLSEIVKEITGGDDCGASEMPIFVGTISKTFWNADTSNVNTNTKFVEMQKTLSEIPGLGNIIIIDNSDYALNEIVNQRTVIVGSDAYHWSQNDHLEIGKTVGRTMLEYWQNKTDELTDEEVSED